jgi:pimeloyl-ACP methyl ester carboxylesterase
MTSGSTWRAESRNLDDAARLTARGAFLQLGRGYTHYESSGAPNAPAVVLVHGFSVPYFIWDPTFHFLAASGFRVVRYDLFGRGFSDRPDVEYGMPLYLEQLEELLDALGIQQADLIGLSMGGLIAASFCLDQPGRVGRLVLIGPSGARPISLGPLYRLAALPGLGDALFRIAGDEHMFRAIAQDFFDPEQVRLFRARYRTQMEFRGFRRAILSTVRNGMLGSFEEAYRRLGQLQKKVLVIWGENDKTVPFEHSRRSREFLPDAQFMPVNRAGHIPHWERPDIINPRLIEFLN